MAKDAWVVERVIVLGMIGLMLLCHGMGRGMVVVCREGE